MSRLTTAEALLKDVQSTLVAVSETLDGLLGSTEAENNPTLEALDTLESRVRGFLGERSGKTCPLCHSDMLEAQVGAWLPVSGFDSDEGVLSCVYDSEIGAELNTRELHCCACGNVWGVEPVLSTRVLVRK